MKRVPPGFFLLFSIFCSHMPFLLAGAVPQPLERQRKKERKKGFPLWLGASASWVACVHHRPAPHKQT